MMDISVVTIVLSLNHSAQIVIECLGHSNKQEVWVTSGQNLWRKGLIDVSQILK